MFFLVLAVYVVVALHIDKKKTRTHVMWEGRLLRSEVVYREGEKLYVEKVAFQDWHVSIHNYYLISDRLTEGHPIRSIEASAIFSTEFSKISAICGVNLVEI